jgi:hypothetical protein
LTADAVGIHVSKKRRAGSNSFNMNGDAPGKRKTAEPRISRNRFAVRGFRRAPARREGGSDENFFIAKNHDSESAHSDFCRDDRAQRHRWSMDR